MSGNVRGVNWQRWVRFLCGGAVNTGATYLLYLGLLHFLDYQVAYVISYAVGIVLAYCLNAIFVFKVRMSWRGLFAYPLVYLVQYAVAAVFLELLVRGVGLPAAVAPLLVTVLLLPLTYLMNKLVLKKTNIRHATHTEAK
jgi:putative flippase GtrA